MDDLLVEGRIRTLDPDRPEASAVLLSGGRVAAVGDAGRIACPGEVWRLDAEAVVLPGFVDAHLHLLSMAAALLSVDCSPDAATTIPELIERLRDAASALPPGAWLRGHGYDDAFLAERRHPRTAELDAAVPDRPVVLHHATGHVVTVNTIARRQLGMDRGDDPVAAASVAGRTPLLGRDDLLDALRRVGFALAAAGVTAVCDATVTNGLGEIELLAGAGLPQQIVVMPGLTRLGEVRDANLRYGAVLPGGTRIGHAKLYVDDEQDPRDVAALVEHAHVRGWPVALHVLDVGPLDTALHALESSPPPARTRDRLEHVALCLPEQSDRIAAAGADVVTQPSFVTRRAAKYLDELSEVEQEWLYPCASLLSRGVRVAASSDAPVVPARPLEAITAATSRVLGPGERIDARHAIECVTSEAAAVCGLASGRLIPGAPADLVILDSEPGPGARLLATVAGGEVVHRSLS